MTKEEAIKQIDGAEMILRNRDFEQFQTACIMAINALRTQQKQERNETMTLDELRQMDGEPVWIERVGRTEQSDAEWALVNCEDALCRSSGGCDAFFELYGISWLAYRNKPKEGAEHG